MYVVQLLPMWVLCCALVSGVVEQGGMFSTCTMARSPRQGPRLSGFLVPEPRLAFLGFPLPQKETAGFGEEGRSLSSLERLPVVVE